MVAVLHIAAHLGGGVGTLAANIFCKDNASSHAFVCLEKPRRTRVLPRDTDLQVFESFSQIYRAMEESDVVQVEFWNHPLIYQLIATAHEWPKCRVILCSYINGIFPPQVLPQPVAAIADRVVLPIKVAKIDPTGGAKLPKTQVINLAGATDIKATSKIKKPRHLKFLYLGTTHPSKIHPRSFYMFREILQRHPSNLEFVICTQDGPEAHREICPKEIEKLFTWLPWTEDVLELFGQADVLVHPLNPTHYGGPDQVLWEAMGAGLPVVVLGDAVSRSNVKDLATGLVCGSEAAFISACLFLASDSEARKFLGGQARRFVRRNKLATQTQVKWQKLYRECVTEVKSIRQSSFALYRQPWNPTRWFMVSQGRYGPLWNRLLNSDSDLERRLLAHKLSGAYSHYKSPAKGSLTQWLDYFPNDLGLNQLAKHLFLRDF